MTKTLTPNIQTLTKRLQKQALVEVRCGLNHASIFIPTKGWKCRYARGFVKHRATGLITYSHDCHLCNGYFLLPATTPPDKQICDNCKGPVIPTGESSCFPDLLIVDNFVTPLIWEDEDEPEVESN